MRRTGVPEVCLAADGGLSDVVIFYLQSACQYVLVGMWRMLWCGDSALDVYHKEFSIFNGISNDITELHFWNVRCRDVLSRINPLHTLGRSVTYYGRLCACGKIERIKK